MYSRDGDGFELISTLRKESPSARIITISGAVNPHTLLQATRFLGPPDVVRTPIGLVELLHAVECALAHLELGHQA